MGLDDFSRPQKIFLVGLVIGVAVGAILSGLEPLEVISDAVPASLRTP